MSLIRSSPHLPVQPSVTRVMGDVLLALVPGVAVYALWFGPGIVQNIVIAALGCVAFEAALLSFRGRGVATPLRDLSAVVTGVLLALSLPAGAPPWLVLTGALFAMALGKHLYGGLGYNPFNPAMVGFVILLISFPVEMTQWPPADPPWAPAVDASSSATPMDHLRTELGRQATIDEARADPRFGVLGARGWEWIALAWLAGGAYLLWRGVIRWQIPVSLLAGVALPAMLAWGIDPSRFASPLFHVVGGATLLGAFFIATDPVSAATTPRGRLVYGFGIGVMTWIIRTWGGYPDAIAFAVLLANLCAPTIDRYTQPRVYGHGRNPAP